MIGRRDRARFHGRTSMHAVLRRRGVSRRFVLPISAVLQGARFRYSRSLADFAAGRPRAWCEQFAQAAGEAATRAVGLAARMEGIALAAERDLGPRRRHAAALKLLAFLPTQPVLDQRTAAFLLGMSERAARRALIELDDAHVLWPVEPGKRHSRTWEVTAMLDAWEAFGGGSRHEVPSRIAATFRENSAW